MKIDIAYIHQKLKERRLKVTPQRVIIYQALCELKCHPTVEQVIDFVRLHNPSIATGTIYKTLDTFVKEGLIKKVFTEGDVTRYDEVTSHHHHLHSTDSECIEDYENEELDELLADFFKKNAIENYKIESIRLQINGKFLNKKKLNN